MAKPTNRVMCPDCGRQKMLFETEKKANLFIKYNSDDIIGGENLRVYYCPSCCGYHVSSKKHKINYDTNTERLLTAYNKTKDKQDYLLVQELYAMLCVYKPKTRFEVRDAVKSIIDDRFTQSVRSKVIEKYYKNFSIKKNA